MADRVKRRIAVTGATGFIGRHLVPYLTARGDEVVAVGRPLDEARLLAAFADADTVVHLAGAVAAMTEHEFEVANVEGTRAVASAAATVGARLVHISSLAAAGPAAASSPRSEDDPPSPITPYGRSKLAGERVVAATPNLRWTVLRPGAVYGPGDRALLPVFRLAARGVLPLVGRAGAAYTFVHVDDVLRAIAAAVDIASDRMIVFVGHPQPVTARELLEGVRAAVGGGWIVRIPLTLTRVVASAGDVAGRLRGRMMPINTQRFAELAAPGFVCRVDRLRDRLGVVAAVDLREGLARNAAWYRQAGWL